MSEIIKYGFEQTRTFMNTIAVSYADKLTEALPFEEWKGRAFTRLATAGKEFGVIPCKLGTHIRVAPTGVQMRKIIAEYSKEIQDIEMNVPIEQQDFEKSKLFREILKPVLEFDYDKPLTVPGTLDGENIDIPVWFNTTMKSVNIRPGFARLDSAYPASLPLSDAPVHAILGGTTGAGKSVLLNSIIVSLLYEYPPWELDLILADFKVVELSRYANRIPTPHVSIVAATESVEFAMSMFQALIDEMEARQAVFTAVGVQNIKSFREKFNLVLPRQVLIADEFVQMYDFIKKAEQAGNDKAGEQKVKINSAISAISRLGRSQGIHMLLSSQNMDGVLDDQTAGQFAAGITLAATPSVSNTLIGNPAGATIRGKGKAYMNLNKVGKDVRDNVIVWVPFIPDNDVSEQEAAQGKLSYIQRSLKQVYDLAQQFGWTRQPYYYNQDDTIPRKVFESHKAYCLNRFQHPDEGSSIHNKIYREISFARLPLGREIAFTDKITYDFTLKRRKRHNLIIASSDDVTKVYIAKLLAEGLSMYPGKHVVIIGNKALFLQIGFDNLIENLEVQHLAAMPSRYMRMATTRTEIMTLQSYFTQQKVEQPWDTKAAFDFYLDKVYTVLPRNEAASVEKQKLLDFASSLNYVFDGLTDLKVATQDSGLELNDSSIRALAFVIESVNTKHKTFRKLTNNFTRTATASCFEPVVIWWVGADEIGDIEDFGKKKEIQSFLESSCQVNIFNVLIAEKWDKLTSLAEQCNFVLEKCAKQFFLDVGLPRDININANSFQIHNREERTRNIIRMFNI